METVIVRGFGGVEQLVLEHQADPQPGPEEVVVRLTSIGMNHAELMARRGEYRLASGTPPFTPGREGGGVVVAVGDAVRDRALGQRVSLSLGAPASRGIGAGTYRSHFVVHWQHTIIAPSAIPDQLLGALWLPYLTAWGCLVAKQNLQPGQTVLIPAASSSVAIAAAQVVKHYGGLAIGTTTRPEKMARLEAMPEAKFDHLICTETPNWPRRAKAIAQGRGYDVIFDPVAAGDFLNQEIRLLAPHGALWVYGLLGEPGVVDVTPLIRKMASLRGWLLGELVSSGLEQAAHTHVLERVADGTYQLPIAGTFPLREVQAAHRAMERGEHIGKLILIPDA